MSRYKRLVSCLLSLSLLVCFAGSFLAVNASAAVSNLVPPLLANWSLQNYKGGDVTVSTVDSGVSSLMIGNTGYGFVYKQLNLIQGHKYRFTVRMIQSSFTWPGVDTDGEGFCTIGFCDNISENKIWLSYAPFFAGQNNTIKSCEFIAGSSPVYALVELVTNGHYCSSRLTDISIIDLGSSDTQSVIDNANQNAQDIQDNLDENTSKIGGWLSDLGDRIKGLFYFEDVITPTWVPRGINDTTGLVGESYYASAAATSDFIKPTAYGVISSDGVIRGDLNANSFRLFVYDTNGTFIRYENFTDDIDITPDNWYRVFTRDYVLAPYSSSTRLTSYMNEHVSIVCKSNVFDNLLHGLINGIKSLFVPSDGYFESLMDTFGDKLEQKLGVLYQIGDFIPDVLNSVKDLIATAGQSDFVFTFPGMSFEFLDYDIDLWDDIEINFTDVFENASWFSILYGAYSIVVQAFFIILIINYAEKLFKEVFRT